MTGPRGFRLGVGDLLDRPGGQRRVERDLVTEELSVSASSIPAGSTVHVELLVEAIAEPGTLTVTGTVRAPWRGECRRCLELVEGILEVEVRDLVSRHPIDDEVWELEGDEIDVGALVREALVLALPLAPLCSIDCRGPAPEDFPALGAAEGGSPEGGDAPVDPRWAALAELRFDDEPSTGDTG